MGSPRGAPGAGHPPRSGAWAGSPGALPSPPSDEVDAWCWVDVAAASGCVGAVVAVCDAGAFALAEDAGSAVLAGGADALIACAVCQDCVVSCEWIPALAHRDDFVDFGAQRVGCWDCYVDVFAADPAGVLFAEDPGPELAPPVPVGVARVSGHVLVLVAVVGLGRRWRPTSQRHRDARRPKRSSG